MHYPSDLLKLIFLLICVVWLRVFFFKVSLILNECCVNLTKFALVSLIITLFLSLPFITLTIMCIFDNKI